MIEWRDEGIVLAVRRLGETDAILSALTFEHGRHAGVVKGGAGRRSQPLLQPGNRLDCTWRARLEDHLGTWRVEPVRLHAGTVLDDPLRLAAIASACAIVEAVLAEREPHPRLYAAMAAFLGRLTTEPDWAADYVRLELLLLEELGFALDLTRCAVTGATTDLAYVSPRTGRAVARDAAGAYAARLLPLPPFLTGGAPPTPQQLAQGLRLAGHFLRRHSFEPADRPIPLARERLAGLLAHATNPGEER